MRLLVLMLLLVCGVRAAATDLQWPFNPVYDLQREWLTNQKPNVMDCAKFGWCDDDWKWLHEVYMSLTCGGRCGRGGGTDVCVYEPAKLF
jgi:hypothetical protein